MRQIDYFKFLKKFPQYIAIEDTNDVKLAMLAEIKKIAKENKNCKLLPVSWKNVNVTAQELFEVGFTAHNINIKYKTKLIFSIFVVGAKNRGMPYLNVEYRSPKNYTSYFTEEKLFMGKDEMTNLKRTILMNDMIK